MKNAEKTINHIKANIEELMGVLRDLADDVRRMDISSIGFSEKLSEAKRLKRLISTLDDCVFEYMHPETVNDDGSNEPEVEIDDESTEYTDGGILYEDVVDVCAKLSKSSKTILAEIEGAKKEFDMFSSIMSRLKIANVVYEQFPFEQFEGFFNTVMNIAFELENYPSIIEKQCSAIFNEKTMEQLPFDIRYKEDELENMKYSVDSELRLKHQVLNNISEEGIDPSSYGELAALAIQLLKSLNPLIFYNQDLLLPEEMEAFKIEPSIYKYCVSDLEFYNLAIHCLKQIVEKVTNDEVETRYGLSILRFNKTDMKIATSGKKLIVSPADPAKKLFITDEKGCRLVDKVVFTTNHGRFKTKKDQYSSYYDLLNGIYIRLTKEVEAHIDDGEFWLFRNNKIEELMDIETAINGDLIDAALDSMLRLELNGVEVHATDIRIKRKVVITERKEER